MPLLSAIFHNLIKIYYNPDCPVTVQVVLMYGPSSPGPSCPRAELSGYQIDNMEGNSNRKMHKFVNTAKIHEKAVLAACLHYRITNLALVNHGCYPPPIE